MNPVELLREIIQEHTPEDIWQESPLRGYRLLGNTNRGAIGEEFVRRYARAHDFEVDNGDRISPTDLQIEGRRVEVKTASQGATGTFQFNHIRLDRNYDCLFCLGICPTEIVFNVWRKGYVMEGRAGGPGPYARRSGCHL